MPLSSCLKLSGFDQYKSNLAGAILASKAFGVFSSPPLSAKPLSNLIETFLGLGTPSVAFGGLITSGTVEIVQPLSISSYFPSVCFSADIEKIFPSCSLIEVII